MKLLLHVCCAPCSTIVISKLQEKYELTLFFYNPCIEPIDEYSKRLEEVERFAKALGLDLIVGDYENIDWHNLVKGHEDEKEGGERCSICFKSRLIKTMQAAEDFDLFTTTLTVSPYKNAEVINRIGKELSPKFLVCDFKKDYMKSVELSKHYNLYRQSYCGCLYSK